MVPADPQERKMMEARLYTRRGCGLCDEAEELLADRLPTLELVDVDADPVWTRLYGLRVPVLTFDGRVVCEGRFSEAAVAALWNH
jgi:glutaredoxin